MLEPTILKNVVFVNNIRIKGFYFCSDNEDSDSNFSFTEYVVVFLLEKIFFNFFIRVENMSVLETS